MAMDEVRSKVLNELQESTPKILDELFLDDLLFHESEPDSIIEQPDLVEAESKLNDQINQLKQEFDVKINTLHLQGYQDSQSVGISTRYGEIDAPFAVSNADDVISAAEDSQWQSKLDKYYENASNSMLDFVAQIDNVVKRCQQKTSAYHNDKLQRIKDGLNGKSSAL